VEVAAPSEHVAAEQAGPEENLAALEVGQKLWRALAELPEEQRAVIALREWDGLEYEAIAAVEDVPVGTIRSRLARARESLRAALEELKEEQRAAR
jgi:RNA polymerase sigma-70 factor (ECF subfamily)